MSKQLDEAPLRSELAGSAFFRSKPPTRPPKFQAAETSAREPIETGTESETETPRHHDTARPAPNGSEGVIEKIRKAVKQLGKEDATYRFTAFEKKALADIVYTYSVGGVRTSQNEITRIGINHLLEDYRRHGEASVLARVLERLNE